MTMGDVIGQVDERAAFVRRHCIECTAQYIYTGILLRDWHTVSLPLIPPNTMPFPYKKVVVIGATSGKSCCPLHADSRLKGRGQASGRLSHGG